MNRLIITCDTLPVPPVNGHSRVVDEIMRALANDFEVEAIAYGSPLEIKAAQEHWSSLPVRFHGLERRTRFRHARAIGRQLSLPTVTRNFPAEARLVQTLAGRHPESKLLIQYISGAPLLKLMPRDRAILSGHDCMSHLTREEARHAVTLKSRLIFTVRSFFAATAERRYAHLAHRVHVVSAQDAQHFAISNPRIRSTVIPIGGALPDAGFLQPFGARTRRVIWGTLDSELIISGLRRILTHVAKSHPKLFHGWTLVGRIPGSRAHQLLPQLNELRIRYEPYMYNITTELGETQVLLLPDIGGTGQKNRTLDGLAHGCCVVGLPEVFRGIESPDGSAYVEAPSYEELVEVLARLEPIQIATCGRNGRKLYEEQFARQVLGRRWRDLLANTPPIGPFS